MGLLRMSSSWSEIDNSHENEPKKAKKAKKRELSQKEKDKGRSPNYHQLTGEEQWDEDKRLGILDWDGD